jgi:hypothetical protein
VADLDEALEHLRADLKQMGDAPAHWGEPLTVGDRRALLAQLTWQPIETAPKGPKDGPVLLYWPVPYQPVTQVVGYFSDRQTGPDAMLAALSQARRLSVASTPSR